MTPFAKLVEICPVFKIRNRTDLQQQIYLNNDSMMVMPNATTNIKAVKLIQMPDKSVFDILEPTLEQLVEAGYVKENETVSIAGDPEKKSTSGKGNHSSSSENA